MSTIAPSVYLSASRLDTFTFCTAKYYANYILKLPDAGNDGSRRGSTVHDTLELLVKPRHFRVYEAAINEGDCRNVTALWRLIVRFAKKHGCNDEDNLDMVNKFILVALRNQFLGPAGTIDTIAEKEFDITVDQDGKTYRIKGFIDQIFTVKGQSGLSLVVRDFKTSSKVFTKDKVEFNLQSFIYQLALRHLFPEIPRSFHFLFLKFPKKPLQDQPSFTDDELDGFEYFLTEMQQAVENFTEKNALDNVAAGDPERFRLCGGDGVKVDGTKKWICPAKKPMDYWTVIDEKGKTVVGAFTEEEAHKKAKDGQRVEKKRYGGCGAHYNPLTEAPRNFA